MSDIRIPIPAVGFHPPVYICRRALKPFVLDGCLDKEFWQDAPFTEPFLDIEGAHMERPRFRTRAKMLWDDENFYFGAILEGDEIWASVTERDDIIFQDNDFEIFIDPDSDAQQYYEFEMNALNTVWDLFLPKAYRDGGSALNGYDINGLQTAVSINGKLNSPGENNHAWSVEIVMPFKALTECFPGHPLPEDGDYYRVNFSRVQWKTYVEDGVYKKHTDPKTGAVLPEDNWVWAPTGVINIHYPEQWGFVFFSNSDTDASSYQIPEEEKIKWELRKLYYAQNISMDRTNSYTDDLSQLEAILRECSPCEENSTVQPLGYHVETTAHSFEISCPGADGKSRLAIFSNGVCKRVV